MHVRIAVAEKSTEPGILTLSYLLSIKNSKGDEVYKEAIPPTIQTDEAGDFVRSQPFDLPNDTYTMVCGLYDQNGVIHGAAQEGSFDVALTAVNLPSSIALVP